MARKASASVADGPLSESARLVEERRKAGLAEAKARKQAQAAFFSDLFVPHVPPDPALEEPPADEPLSEEDREIERAFLESATAATAADVEALAAYAGAEEGPSIAEELEAAHEALEDAVAAQAGREAFVEHVLEPLTQAASDALLAEADARDLEQTGAELLTREEAVILADRQLAEAEAPNLEEIILGPDSLGGSDSEAEAPGSEASEVLSPASGAAPMEEPGASPSPFALFGHNIFGDAVKPQSSGPLSDRFKLPPFTVFDARQGIWQDRKRAWLALGIQSEVGRGENLLNMSDTVLEPDPVKRAEMQRQREETKLGRAFGQDFRLGAQPYDRADGSEGGEGKSWPKKDGSRGGKPPAATAVSQRLAPGGGGGGAWLGGPKTASSAKFQNGALDRKHGIGTTADPYRKEGEPVQGASATGTSIFDPVLTELLYSWFSPPAGDIYDPFAGGSVRGIVAAKLGRRYVGIELRPEQIAANEKQGAAICVGDDFQPTWIEGDSTHAAELLEGALFDFVIACPPYGDLEQYSDDPRDLSNMEYDDFCSAYAKIIAAALERLKPDRFACFVIGDIRDEKGFYRGLPELTVRAFEEAGAKKYNEAVLVTSVGSLPIRIGKQFSSGRKLGKTHQNVLCFVKGDPRKAAEACGGQQEFSL